MDHAFLKSDPEKIPGRVLISMAVIWITSILNGCQIFNDPRAELDPTLHDSTLISLPASENFQVPRQHILESFGSFGCVSCPGAETRLLPYLHPELKSPGYHANLLIVNYHVTFGTIHDPWVTAGTQARYDQSFANSLPQITLDGSNAPFGIRENDVDFSQGEYDSLVYRLPQSDSTYLDLNMDTAGLVYDGSDSMMHIHFTVLNRDTAAQGALFFRVLAVKNLPVTIPIYPTTWEVIVAETTVADSAGRPMSLSGLAALKAKPFSVVLKLPPENGKQVSPPPLGMENPQGYALVVFVKNENGLILNAYAHNYHPEYTH